MAAVNVGGGCLFVTVGHVTIVTKLGTDSVQHLRCQKIPIKNSKRYSNQQDRTEEWILAPASDISKCGSHFAFAYKKCLSLWKVSDLSLISNHNLIKSVSKVKFLPKGNRLLVSDKAGDVYVFSVDEPTHPGMLLLGHLSMLLDVICTPDEKYVITCDRDEKIRVSLYPNAYNINSYCLGHEQFVTSVFLLPHSEDILVSSSGDGSIRFWDYRKGKELLKYDCSSDIDRTNSEIYASNLQSSYAPIMNCASFKLNNNVSIISLIIEGFKGSLIYKIKGNFSAISCEINQILSFSDSPCDIYSCNDMLWFILNKEHFEVLSFQWKDEDNIVIPTVSDRISNAIHVINDQLKLFDKSTFKNVMCVLYKHSYDNVQEYYKRKNERILLEKAKKNKTL